jgi:hypothetical protein
MRNKLGFCNTPGDLITEMYCSVTTNTCEYRRAYLRGFSPLCNLSTFGLSQTGKKSPFKGTV